MPKITKHITFFYNESRFQYLNKLIENANRYPYQTDIFIHANQAFHQSKLIPYTNGLLKLIPHDISKLHPHFLAWKSRQLMPVLRDDYDIFICVEDDVLIPWKAIQYWLAYKRLLTQKNYILGFMRIEIGKDGLEYTPDLSTCRPTGKTSYLTKPLSIGSQNFVVNDVNPYWGFWIYDKQEFNRFLNDSLWTFDQSMAKFGIRESSVDGMRARYKATVMPIKNGRLHPACRVYHLPNTYLDLELGLTHYEFKDVVQIPSKNMP